MQGVEPPIDSVRPLKQFPQRSGPRSLLKKLK